MEILVQIKFGYIELPGAARRQSRNVHAELGGGDL